METLVTKRLVLRLPCPADESVVVEAMNNLSVVGWLALPPYPYGTEDFHTYLRESARPGEAWALTEAGTACGMLSLRGGKLGYWLLPGCHGRGLMTEAAQAVLAFHFANGGGPVDAGYFEGNEASARVLQKLGFVEVSRETAWCGPLACNRPHVSLRLTGPEHLP